MPKAVRYDEFGGIDVLRVDEVIGFSNNRASQAELVLAVAGNLTPHGKIVLRP